MFRTDKPPFDNPKLRQAVNYAVDRTQNSKIIGGALKREPWSQLLSSNLMADQPTDIYPNTPDVDKAKALVAESGVATPIKIELVHFAEDPAPQQAQAIKESLDAVGFDVTLKAVSSDAFYGVLDDDTAPWSIGLAGWGQDYSDAITFFRPLLSCPGGKPTGSNYGNFCDAAFDAKIDRDQQDARRSRPDRRVGTALDRYRDEPGPVVGHGQPPRRQPGLEPAWQLHLRRRRSSTTSARTSSSSKRA